MFNRTIAASILMILVLISVCVIYFYSSTEESQIAYRRLMDMNLLMKKEQLDDDHPSKQTRTQVSKQILYQKGTDRMESRLISDASDLIYSKKEGELMERFTNLTCILQEKLEPVDSVAEREKHGDLQQNVRQFKAKNALYLYKKGQLEADDVEITHYLIPGAILPQSLDEQAPVLQGKAHTVYLSLFKDTTMKAQGFQAMFQHRGEEW